MRSHPFIFGFAGWSGSGKTTLAEKLIKKAVAASLSVATIKHAHHEFDADHEGKDSYRHRKAGAQQVLVASQHRSALFTENHTPQRPQLADLLAQLGASDWVLVEGFKAEPFPKIEIYDKAVSEVPLFQTDDSIIAVMTTTPIETGALPCFDRDDVAGLFSFLVTQDNQEISRS